MNKEQFLQYIYRNYTIGDNVMARTLLENVVRYADGMDEDEQYKFLCAVIPNVPERVIRAVAY